MDVKKSVKKNTRDNNKVLKEQYLLAQKTIRYKNEFLVKLSHEMRNALSGIEGLSELMFNGDLGPVTAKQKEYLGDILFCSKNLLQLLNVLRSSANIESCQEPIDLKKFMDAFKSPKIG